MKIILVLLNCLIAFDIKDSFSRGWDSVKDGYHSTIDAVKDTYHDVNRAFDSSEEEKDNRAY